MNHLTKHEQLVLCVVIGLLLTGWAVKVYRQAHPLVATNVSGEGTPVPAAAEQAKP